MKKLNKIKNFLFRKESKNYVALFVLLFTLGVGNAWGEELTADQIAAIDWKGQAGTVGEGNFYLYEEASNTKSNVTYYVKHFLKDGGTTAANFSTNSPLSAQKFTLVQTPSRHNHAAPVFSIQFKDGNTTKYVADAANWTNTAKNQLFIFTDSKTGSETISRYSIKSDTLSGTTDKGKYILLRSTENSADTKNFASTTSTTTYAAYNYHWYLIPEASFHSVGHYFRCDADVKVVTCAYGATPDRSTGTNNSAVARVAFLDVAFASMPTDANVIGDTRRWATTYNVPVYFKQNGISGYNFRGWYDGDGNQLSTDPAYGTTITVSNTSTTANRTHKTVYAYFEEAPLFQATLLDASGNTVMDGDDPKQYSLADALVAAQTNYTVVLQEDVAITSTLNLNKAIKLDFNNHTLSSALDAAVNVTSTITFVDNSLVGAGGVSTTGATAVSVGNGGNLTIKDGFYNAATYAVAQTGTGIVTIQNGGFKGGSQDVSGTITFNGGYYVNNGGLSVSGNYAISENIPAGLKFSSSTYHYAVVDTSSPSYIACTADGKNFSSLEAALAYANNNANTTMTILLKEDCELPAGTYTLPAKAILLVPYSADQTMVLEGIETPNVDEPATNAYRTLTFANGAHLDAFGRIEVGGRQTTGPLWTGGEVGVSRPVGTYGLIVMKPGSSITMNNGSELRAWGYILGDGSKDGTGKYLSGEIDVRRGAVVREQFQVMDWKGLTCAVAMNSGTDVHHKVLPVSQYYIQNIEVPATYHPGANLWGCVSVLYDHSAQTMTVKDGGVIGVWRSENDKDLAMFLMKDEDYSDDTWVRKWYDRQNDKQVYEVNNSAFLGSLRLQMHILTFDCDVDSREYVLPIPSNFKMHLLTGELVVTQDTELQPGSEMIANKKSTIYIAENVTLVLDDASEWGDYVIKTYDHTNHTGTWVEGTTVKWIPAIGDEPAGQPNKRPQTAVGLGDAKLTVHGTVDVRGSIATPASGASITSTIEDAGTVIFTAAVPETANIKGFSGRPDLGNNVYHVSGFTGSSERPNYISTTIVPALLKNDEGSQYGAFSQTANTPANKSYCFIDMDGDGKGEWISLTADVDEDFDPDYDCVSFVYDNYGVFYIKPQAYVPISIGRPTEEADHTYRDHYAGTGKIFIQLPGCQWWEVEAVEGHPGIFHCTHPQNNTYYYYNGDEWIEKRFNVKWKNWDGTLLDTYQLTYMTTPKYLGSTPQRAASAYYTYDFDGWSPEIVPVTKDTTYTAKYIQTDRKYLITFQRPGNVLIEQQYVKVGVVPECQSYTLTANQEWSPALSAVTGDATYTLNDKNINGPFEINYYNWNGGDPLKTENLAKDASLTPPSDPSKPALQDEQYSFIGWKAANGTVYASNALPVATENANYTATFNASPKTYTIRFFKEGGSAQIGSNQSVAYGAMPVIPAYSKENPEAYTDYTLVWSPLVGSVTSNQDYIATFTEKTRQYRVDWKDGDDNIIETKYVDYGATPVYSGITPTKASDATYAYNFTGWDRDFETVESDQVYTAQFNPVQLAMDVTDPQTITSSVSVQTITIETTGTLTVNPGAIVTADALILESNVSDASGQMIIPSSNSIHATNVYFDLKLNTEARHWHAFGVPWTIGNLDDVKLIADGQPMTLGRDYEIIYYNGATRASQGAGAHCWEYVTDHGKTLTPGLGYMIAFGRAVNTIRFTKATGTPILFNGTVELQNEYGDGDDNGWNALANPMAFHAAMAEGPTVGYVHNGGEIGSDGYVERSLDNKRWIVGKMVYVQAAGDQPIVFNASSATPISPATAPARRANTGRVTDKRYLSLSDYYQVGIADANAEGGSVYVLPEEEKEDKYVIGHDLSHLGISDQKAQIWVFRYGTKLALNTTAPVDGVADYALRVYAPKNGEYTITNIQSPMSDEEYVLYLTRDGEAIWNLSDGAYTAELTAGVHKEYGLRLSARKSPAVVTGMDEAVVDAKGETRKVLINNQVFIIRGENVYSIDGQLVK